MQKHSQFIIEHVVVLKIGLLIFLILILHRKPYFWPSLCSRTKHYRRTHSLLTNPRPPRLPPTPVPPPGSPSSTVLLLDQTSLCLDLLMSTLERGKRGTYNYSISRYRKTPQCVANMVLLASVMHPSFSCS